MPSGAASAETDHNRLIVSIVTQPESARSDPAAQANFAVKLPFLPFLSTVPHPPVLLVRRLLHSPRAPHRSI